MKYYIKIVLIIFPFIINLFSATQNLLHSQSDILLIKEDNAISPDLIFDDAVNAGYTVEITNPESVTSELLNQHRLTILSTGNNPNPCSNTNMRYALSTYITEGGKIIIEGGQNGFVASVFPLYPAFRNKVLKIQTWITDSGGDLLISANHVQSNLANYPNVLPARIQINYNNIYDQDVCTKNEYSDIFFRANSGENYVGILVAPDVLNPRVINYCFNYSAVTYRSDAKNLLTNSIYNLIGNSVGVNNTELNIPERYELLQNYPNPFNPSTVIGYQLTVRNFVSLKVYDVMGKEVATLVNQAQNAGSYAVDFNAGNFSSGIYYYKLFTEKYSETKKMLLIK